MGRNGVGGEECVIGDDLFQKNNLFIKPGWRFAKWKRMPMHTVSPIPARRECVII